MNNNNHFSLNFIFRITLIDSGMNKGGANLGSISMPNTSHVASVRADDPVNMDSDGNQSPTSLARKLQDIEKSKCSIGSLF